MSSIKKDALLRLISKKTNFTLKDTGVFLDGLIEVFEDCSKSLSPIDVRGWGHLEFLPVKGGKHRFSLDDKMTQYPDSVRMVFSLAKNLRDFAKIRYRERNDYE